MFDKGNAPPAPDYSPLIALSREVMQNNAALQKESLDWAKAAYAENKEISDEVVNRFLDTQERQSTWAQEDRDRYKSTFQPMEDSLVADAQSYGSEGRRDLERGRAISNVGQQFDAARHNAQRDLEAYGINPAATRYAALDLGIRAQEAAAKASAANQADQQTDATARALRTEAINVGRGYPAQSNQTQSVGMQGGTGAVNTGLATTASGANTMGTPVQYGGLTNSALGTTGNLMNQQHSTQMATWKGDQESSSGLGSLLGLGASIGAKAFLGPTMPWVFANEGGAIPDPNYVSPGASPSGGGAIDDVNARLTAGEFVIPRETVDWFGQKFFQNLIEKAQKSKQGAPAKPQMAALPMRS